MKTTENDLETSYIKQIEPLLHEQIKVREVIFLSE